MYFAVKCNNFTMESFVISLHLKRLRRVEYRKKEDPPYLFAMNEIQNF